MGTRNTRAIKEQVVARIRANAEPMLTLAREYGVSTNTLRAWVRESDIRRRAQDDARRVADALTEESSFVSQRERGLMHALEFSPATIIVTDVEGRIVYANPKFVETTGYAIGGVPPVGHARPLPVFIDRDLTRHPELFAAAGTPRAVFRLTPGELCRLTEGRVEDLKRCE